MTTRVPLSTGQNEEPDLHRIKRRFLALNQDWLRRVRESLRPRQQIFMDLLPLLFHINHPLLPGYIGSATPAGVCEYQPGRNALAAAKRLAKAFTYVKRALRRYDIEALFLMGSGGTVAYSDKSDFDIWVCHRPDLDSAQCATLRDKCAAISSWAASLDLEVHFFVMDAEGFRKGVHDALSQESSGSTQHYLLLEEFYRTGLVVAGRFPLWWLVPPDKEAEYESYAADLLHKRFVKASEVVDLGPVRLSPGEFFGASLWQIYKGIDSPYKAVLKILLMEVYAREYPNVDLLSSRFKRAVYEGEANLDRLDPYVMMMWKVEDYIQRTGDLERLELARRCFYFKVNERLSTPPRFDEPGWRRALMLELVQEWGWDPSYLLVLDSRDSWKIDRVLEERRLLVDELTRSYRMLSSFARQHGPQTQLNPADLNRLGRKLYAAFERKAGKVEIINPGISTDLAEPQLSIHQTIAKNEEGSWLLFRGDVKSVEEDEWPLKRVRSVVELIAWVCFNGLMDARTLVSLHTWDSHLTIQEFRSIADSIRQLFPQVGFADEGMEELDQPPRVLASALFINVGVDPMAHFTRQGVHLISDRSDALGYGALWENLVVTLDHIVVTSWQEILTFRYTGQNGLLDCLCEYLKWAPIPAGPKPPVVNAQCFSSPRRAIIARRVGALFDEAMRCFYDEPYGASARYVLRIEHSFCVLQPENGTLRYRRLASHAELLEHLGAAQRQFSPVKIDPYATINGPLPIIFAHNQPGVVQLFYYITGERVEIYVVDEKGSLFHQEADFHDGPTLLSQYQRFFDTVLPRRDFLTAERWDISYSEGVEFYQVFKDEHGRWQLVRRQSGAYGNGHNYFDVQVIGDVVDGKTALTVYCGDREFSSLEFGEELMPTVARHILRQRASGERYPIYITDLDLSRAMLAADAIDEVQTVHFLQYKKRFEDSLRKALG